MKREEQILKRLTEQEGGLFYDTALRAMREFAKKDLLPPAEGAEEIKTLVTQWEQFKNERWWNSEAIDVLAVLINEFSLSAGYSLRHDATLHAQKIADKMVEATKDCYPKEFVEWKDKKELRYSSLHNRYYSDTDNGMREFTLDELFNYWKENEQEEHPTNKEKFDGNYLPDPD